MAITISSLNIAHRLLFMEMQSQQIYLLTILALDTYAARQTIELSETSVYTTLQPRLLGTWFRHGGFQC